MQVVDEKKKRYFAVFSLKIQNFGVQGIISEFIYANCRDQNYLN